MTTALLLDILDKHLKEAQTIYIAGWSSPVARRAHNPKVVSSNLAPATKFAPEPLGSGASSVSGIFAVFASDPFSDPYGERTGKV